MNPLVSIIIPVYNGSNYLAEAIDSALAQTYKNIEIIVINDGSNDDGKTEQVALSYGEKIRYYAKENGGVSSALNFGIEQMSGEYFSWLSHDDIYLPEKIDSQVKKIRTNQDIVLCYGSLMDKDKKPIKYRVKMLDKQLDGKGLFNKYIQGYGLNGLGFLIPKNVFADVGYFDESMRYLQDLDLWLRILWGDYRFICHKESLVVSRVHKAQTTNIMQDHFAKDRASLAVKHINLLNGLQQEKRKEFLKLYLLLFAKGGNKKACGLVKAHLKKGDYKGIRFKYFYYCFQGWIKNLFRKIREKIFKMKNLRG